MYKSRKIWNWRFIGAKMEALLTLTWWLGYILRIDLKLVRNAQVLEKKTVFLISFKLGGAREKKRGEER